MQLPQGAQLDLIKTAQFNDENGNNFAETNETITYTFTVENIGNVPITGITIEDDLVGAVPGEISLAPDDPPDSTTFTAKYTITDEDIEAGGVTNQATVTGKDPSNNDVTATSSDGSGTPGKETFTELKRGSSLYTVVKSSSEFKDANGNGYADEGEIITYNRNGYQDEGEPGLAGVRVVTVKGLLITTDKNGRFNVACADLPDGRIGSTFIMKLDPRTLPTGYRIVSENPRTVRLTAGKMSSLNFAATIGRVVRVDLNDAAFEPGLADLRREWLVQLPNLISMLEGEVSVLRLAYVDAAADRKLAGHRTKQLRRAIADLWKARPRRYRLEIETRIETRQ